MLGDILLKLRFAKLEEVYASSIFSKYWLVCLKLLSVYLHHPSGQGKRLFSQNDQGKNIRFAEKSQGISLLSRQKLGKFFQGIRMNLVVLCGGILIFFLQAIDDGCMLLNVCSIPLAYHCISGPFARHPIAFVSDGFYAR